ncbi:MAG: glycosyltransferase, partial [Planctomycetes bacterium]|nr:glycosyltransferase [Planctomycetota bacterium]
MHNKPQENLVGVSIIVPVYNDEKHIAPLIESLLSQDYRHDLLEIIIVDNNSTDRSREIIQRYPVTLLEEKEIQSSYASRNRGINSARHDVLAFIDSDCLACKQWIAKGVERLLGSGVDLVGAKVEFTLSSKRAAAEMFDAVTHFDFENSIREGRGTGAGNLFVHRYVFEEIGLFPGNVESGGDFQWSNRAIQNGFRLVYSPDAVVSHPARGLRALLKKRWRTGGGTLGYWRKAGLAWWKILLLILRMFLPRRFSMLKKAVSKRGTPDMHRKILRIWGISYICTLT